LLPLSQHARITSKRHEKFSSYDLACADSVVAMPFKRTIEIGRVALCNYGEDAGKLFVIVDILDATRVR
jgi:hypothetical protein